MIADFVIILNGIKSEAKKHWLDYLLSTYNRLMIKIFLNRGIREGQLQDVFHDAACKILSTSSRPAARTPKAVSGWIGCISDSIATDFHRKNRKWKTPFTESTDEPAITETHLIEDKEEIIKLHNCINSLPESLRPVMQLRYLKLKTQAEIAEELQLSINTVRSYEDKGKTSLRRCMMQVNGSLNLS